MKAKGISLSRGGAIPTSMHRENFLGGGESRRPLEIPDKDDNEDEEEGEDLEDHRAVPLDDPEVVHHLRVTLLHVLQGRLHVVVDPHHHLPLRRDQPRHPTEGLPELDDGFLHGPRLPQTRGGVPLWLLRPQELLLLLRLGKSGSKRPPPPPPPPPEG
ncbi:hypothetical protein Naga_102230g1 [Nannochloropsis gaditana]|uniref:Uncharacterized protein n=1 Tax=Nannochloropsis gaditana TaxID=72520 RepID=W7SZX3_9STRA|nr:hypothetical protein Naga_102230g1 [Nannochloropsis gaditana]